MSGPVAYRQIQFQAPPGSTELVLVRHGESEAAVEGEPFELIEGHGNPSLSTEGLEQAELVGARLAIPPAFGTATSSLCPSGCPSRASRVECPARAV